MTTSWALRTGLTRIALDHEVDQPQAAFPMYGVSDLDDLPLLCADLVCPLSPGTAHPHWQILRYQTVDLPNFVGGDHHCRACGKVCEAAAGSCHQKVNPGRWCAHQLDYFCRLIVRYFPDTKHAS